MEYDNTAEEQRETRRCIDFLNQENHHAAANQLILLSERLRFERELNGRLERRIDDLENHLAGEPVCAKPTRSFTKFS